MPTTTLPFLGAWFLILTCLSTLTRCDHHAAPFEWDLAVSHGNNVTLISLSTNSSSNFALPLPLPQTYSTDSQENARLGYEVLAQQWARLEITSLVSVPERYLLFFSHFNKNLTNVGVFNLVTNQTTLIFQSPGGSVDYMVYHNFTLYFVEEKSQIIMSVNTLELNSSLPASLDTVMKFSNSRVSGLAIDHNTGTLYWSTSKPGPSTISFSNGTKQGILLDSDLNRAHGLIISDSYIYFINTPQSGPRFKIERVSLLNPSDRQVVLNYKHHMPFSITLLCGRLYWTDFMSKSVYALDLEKLDAENPILTKIFESTSQSAYIQAPSPYAVERRLDLDTASCLERNLTVSNEKIPVVLDKDFSKDAHVVEHRPLTTSVSNNAGPSLLFCEATTCLNGATCVSLDSKDFCLCHPDYTGPKCDLKWEQHFIESNLPNAQFAASSTNDATAKYIILSLTLAFILLAVSIITILLGVKLYKLSGAPRIKRRVIVARTSRGPSETGDGTQQTVSEMIDIENCCNMNICDTPCYSTEGSRINLNGRFPSSVCEDDKERLLDC